MNTLTQQDTYEEYWYSKLKLDLEFQSQDFIKRDTGEKREGRERVD